MSQLTARIELIISETKYNNIILVQPNEASWTLMIPENRQGKHIQSL